MNLCARDFMTERIIDSEHVALLLFTAKEKMTTDQAHAFSRGYRERRRKDLDAMSLEDFKVNLARWVMANQEAISGAEGR